MTTKTQHTPGQWEADIRLAQSTVIDKNGNIIADIARDSNSCTAQTYTDENIAANARLIAAAPELLAACEALVEAIEGHEARTKVYQMHPAIEIARAAIAKAEGGE